MTKQRKKGHQLTEEELIDEFIGEHGREPGAQELHNFELVRNGRGEPASHAEAERLLAGNERANELDRLAEDNSFVRQMLTAMQKRNPERSRRELLQEMDIIGRMIGRYPGMTREQAVQWVKDLGF